MEISEKRTTKEKELEKDRKNTSTRDRPKAYENVPGSLTCFATGLVECGLWLVLCALLRHDANVP